ncbi:MAG: 3-oxoacyl-ACP reductase FabG [Clostridia bacterium]|nr:3-oxoacyl-ACP reductase FabG [Clostridia bacterium]
MKNVFVTGASGGIGAAAVERFAAAGYTVFAGYNDGRREAEELSRRTGAIPVRVDVSSEGSVTVAFRFIEEKAGGVDVLVNCAGIAAIRLFDEITVDEWDRMFAVNVRGTFLTSRAAVPYMIRRKAGKIINVSSMWGITGASCEVHYSASKAAVIGMTKALARELAPSGITVNCVAPGAIETRMIAHMSEDDRKEFAEEIPLGRLGEPRDVAGVILFLASSDADYITGSVISPDGGVTI